MKRTKEEMEQAMQVKYFQSPPIVREGIYLFFVIRLAKVDSEDCGSSISSSLNESLRSLTTNSGILNDTDAGSIYKKLKAEVESQNQMNM